MESGAGVVEEVARSDGRGATFSRLPGLVRAARPAQWVKNLACFAGLIFAGRLLQAHWFAMACVACAGFCLASSGVYLINDVCDRERDRQNPSKRRRPIASGQVPVSWAVATAVVLLVAAVGSSLALPRLCTAVLGGYIVMGLAYSIRLKHTVLLDVIIIAVGFVLRVLYGVYAVEVKATSWIVLCMFFLALFLGFAKRRGELNQLEAEGFERRPVLRKYHIGYLDLLLGMTATMAILCYSLYTVTGRHGNGSLVVTVPLVVYGIFRCMHSVVVHGAGETPERDFFLDRITLAIGVVWVGVCILLIYVLDTQLFAPVGDLP